MGVSYTHYAPIWSVFIQRVSNTLKTLKLTPLFLLYHYGVCTWTQLKDRLWTLKYWVTFGLCGGWDYPNENQLDRYGLKMLNYEKCFN